MNQNPSPNPRMRGGDLIDLIMLNRLWEIEDALEKRKALRRARQARSRKSANTRFRARMDAATAFKGEKL